MLKEILEASGKWVFEKSNPGLSGSPTITMSNDEAEYSVGWNAVDKEWFGSATGGELFAEQHDGKNGWQDLMGPQGDYSAVEFSSESIKDVIQALKKEFGIRVSEKDYTPLVMASAGL